MQIDYEIVPICFNWKARSAFIKTLDLVVGLLAQTARVWDGPNLFKLSNNLYFFHPNPDLSIADVVTSN